MGERGSIKASAGFLILLAMTFGGSSLHARPRYRQNLKKHYGERLSKALDACTTCHVRGAEGLASAFPERMPPHNPFGARLRELGKELLEAGKPSDIFARLEAAADEDSDGDGAANEIEILAGRAPGDPSDVPGGVDGARAAELQAEMRRLAMPYRWRPFERVVRPAVPAVKNPSWTRNPIDAFIAIEHERHGLAPRPEASRHVLLRRLHLDLTGLPPLPEEIRAFLDDLAPDAYEKVVDRLLASPRLGERWARHWMDVWRYSDWAGWGNQVRDSQPHIWRWRDWIVESLNADKGYDRMVVEMFAGDEVAPLDRDVLRATGYLVRSFKLLSREAWMQETVDHAAQAFLGVTAGCARCHNHMYDPISQEDYYRLRAFFEPIHVRLDRVPGEADTAKDGLARVFDEKPDAPTYLFIRGDDRKPIKERPLAPGVPAALGGPPLVLEPVPVPLAAQIPEKAAYVVEETLAAAVRAVPEARSKFQAALIKAVQAEAAVGSAMEGDARVKAEEAARTAREEATLAEMDVPLAEARHAALAATMKVEQMEDGGGREKDMQGWTEAATAATAAQRWRSLLEARRGRVAAERAAEAARVLSEAAQARATEKKDDPKLAGAAKKSAEELNAARAKLGDAEKALENAKAQAILPPSTEYAKRPLKTYPAASTGRRLALARWIAHRDNPLAARVAANHIWRRYFGQGLAPTPADLGQNGREPTHPALLDWLAAELMEPESAPGAPWSMKRIHRLIVTSSAYRMASTPDPANLAADPDDRWLWRMPSRRLEAEIVRDAVLHVSGRLDPTFGGPEVDHKLALSTRRRSIYYRHAAEKQSEFLRLFDMAAASECYERKTSIVPQQALALANSELTIVQSRLLARALLGTASGDPASFARAAFERVLGRPAAPAEVEEAARFLEGEEERYGKEKDRVAATAGDAADGAKPSGDPRLRSCEGLVHVLMNHNDFVTVR